VLSESNVTGADRTLIAVETGTSRPHDTSDVDQSDLYHVDVGRLAKVGIQAARYLEECHKTLAVREVYAVEIGGDQDSAVERQSMSG
jgi:hypothetical protein